MKPCNLRKTCEECGTEYGRRIQKSTHGQETYQSEKSFNESHYCCNECKNAAEKRRRAEMAEEKARAKAKLAESFRKAFKDFCYPGARLDTLVNPLTKSQQHVLNMKERGYSNESIAARMNKSIQCIRTALNEIKKKGWVF